MFFSLWGSACILPERVLFASSAQCLSAPLVGGQRDRISLHQHQAETETGVLLWVPTSHSPCC